LRTGKEVVDQVQVKINSSFKKILKIQLWLLKVFCLYFFFLTETEPTIYPPPPYSSHYHNPSGIKVVVCAPVWSLSRGNLIRGKDLKKI